MKKIKIQKKDVIYLSIIAALLLIITAISVICFLETEKENQISNMERYYNNKCSSFATQNVNLSKGQIVFVGDSITDLFPLDDYFADLDLACYNRGIGGDTTRGLIDRLNVSIFDIKPSKIVLMIGTNDVDGGKDNDYIIENYRVILDKIRSSLPDAEIYFMSVIPQNKDLEASSGLDVTKNNEQIIALNAEIELLSREYDCIYIDLFSALLDESGYLRSDCSDDGLHLNANGFKIWADILRPMLKMEENTNY